MSEDPIGLDGGLNVYAYAGDDPMDMEDPFGLEPGCGLFVSCGRKPRTPHPNHSRSLAGRYGVAPTDEKTPGWLSALGNYLWNNLAHCGGTATQHVICEGALPLNPFEGLGGLGNIGGGAANADTILTQAEKYLGQNYEEIAPGVYPSEDGLSQFRMTTSDLTDPVQGPHVHFEPIAPDGRTIIENSHVGIIP